jgi:GNAT superfamily N-acetyltransferase
MEEHNADNPGADAAIIERSLEVFAHGFGFTRSFTHPYLAERVGPVWVLRDGPRRRGRYRNEEWLAYGVAPAEVDRIAREETRGRYVVCAICGIDEPQEPLRAAFKSLGYRLGRTEPLMIHSLAHIPTFDAPAVVERVTSADMAERLARAARSRQILPEHLTQNAPLRQYVALMDGEPVGWVRSIVVGDATWCSDMYVHPPVRRRGIARSMLCRMLHDDRAAGARLAVLLASHAGAKLYPVVGYEQIGTLLLFQPRKR